MDNNLDEKEFLVNDRFISVSVNHVMNLANHIIESKKKARVLMGKGGSVTGSLPKVFAKLSESSEDFPHAEWEATLGKGSPIYDYFRYMRRYHIYCTALKIECEIKTDTCPRDCKILFEANKGGKELTIDAYIDSDCWLDFGYHALDTKSIYKLFREANDLVTKVFNDFVGSAGGSPCQVKAIDLLNKGETVGTVADLLYNEYDEDIVNRILVGILRPHRVEP